MVNKVYVVRYWDSRDEEYKNFDHKDGTIALYRYIRLSNDKSLENLSLFYFDLDTETVEEVLCGQYPQDLI